FSSIVGSIDPGAGKTDRVDVCNVEDSLPLQARIHINMLAQAQISRNTDAGSNAPKSKPIQSRW
ncbi:hypothetical protein MK139_14375, partial [bacterium]|nr:hypothetical protein [bacterium]